VKLIAGVDEAGRGPLAGPIVAAAVILPEKFNLDGLNDSKLLSSKKREQLFSQIKKIALAIGVAKVSHKQIDKLNIHKANFLVMKLAVQALEIKPDFLLIDGPRHKVDLDIAQKSIKQGDRKYACIAAASIIAKVTRDRIMKRYHKKYPQYGFSQHKGYGTKLHYKNLSQHGPCAIHRRSFSLIASN